MLERMIKIVLSFQTDHNLKSDYWKNVFGISLFY